MNVTKKCLLFLTFSLLPTVLPAVVRDRRVVRDTICACTPAHWREIRDLFFYQFQTNSDSLFNWAYVNTGDEGDKEGKDAIKLVYGPGNYDPVTRRGDQQFDIWVLGSKMFTDRHLGTANHGDYLTATYSGSMLEGANIILRSDSLSPMQTAVYYEFHLRFGKFFSIFVNNRVWQNAVAWRLNTVFDNIIEFAEKGLVTVRPPKKKE